MPKVQLPLGIQTFEEIILDNYLYVDKTELIYKLAHMGKFIVLNRPRRFGKSLLISTLQAYFQGRQNLFHGLKISDIEKEWIKYPILRFDLNNGIYNTKKRID